MVPSRAGCACFDIVRHDLQGVSTISLRVISRLASAVGRHGARVQEAGADGSWQMGGAPERSVHDQHSEFVMGMGWALFDQGLLASCAWDQEVHLFRV